MAVAVAGKGTNVGVAGAEVVVAVADTAGSGVPVGAFADVGAGDGVNVDGYNVNCCEERVGNSTAVGVTVGVLVPFGKNPYAA